MQLPVTCAACGQSFRVDARYAGRRGKCPNPDCRQTYTVPSADSDVDQELPDEVESSPRKSGSLSWGERAKASRKARPKVAWYQRIDRPSFLVGAGLSAVIALIAFVAMGMTGSTKRNSQDRKSTRLNSSHIPLSRMPSSA